MGSYLNFDMRVKRCYDNEQVAQGNFQYTQLDYVLTKGMFVCFKVEYKKTNYYGD